MNQIIMIFDDGKSMRKIYHVLLLKNSTQSFFVHTAKHSYSMTGYETKLSWDIWQVIKEQNALLVTLVSTTQTELLRISEDIFKKYHQHKIQKGEQKYKEGMNIIDAFDWFMTRVK